jgi:hypothetical protein
MTIIEKKTLMKNSVKNILLASKKENISDDYADLESLKPKISVDIIPNDQYAKSNVNNKKVLQRILNQVRSKIKVFRFPAAKRKSSDMLIHRPRQMRSSLERTSVPSDYHFRPSDYHFRKTPSAPNNSNSFNANINKANKTLDNDYYEIKMDDYDKVPYSNKDYENYESAENPVAAEISKNEFNIDSNKNLENKNIGISKIISKNLDAKKPVKKTKKTEDKLDKIFESAMEGKSVKSKSSKKKSSKKKKL